jgi:hypothetical protein
MEESMITLAMKKAQFGSILIKGAAMSREFIPHRSFQDLHGQGRICSWMETK